MPFRIRQLSPDSAPDDFPDADSVGMALGYPEGLVAVGGDLLPERLLAAYRRGLFPWFNDDQPILWWSPDPRAIIRPEAFHVSRSLMRLLRRDNWSYSLNQAFTKVIAGCATNRGQHGTWITADMRLAYTRLHELGYAHSVESWFDGELAGGIYGICLGRIFFGESMFSSRSGGSKVAISGLIRLCRDSGIELLDCQMENPHLQTLGAQTLSRKDFLALVRKLAVPDEPRKNWSFEPQPTRPLAGLGQAAGPIR